MRAYKEENMNIEIRYYTRSGNTKKLAEAISGVVGVPAKTIDVPLESEVDILFLGSSVYAFGIDENVTSFINSLDSTKVKKVVNFSTAALVSSTYSQVSKLIKNKSIPIESREFHCRGKFKFMHKNRPNDEDIKAIKEFTEKIIRL